MLNNEDGRLRSIAWMEICPWLAIFKTFRLAVGVRALILAALAIFITFAGWGMIGKMFSGGSDVGKQMATYCSTCPGESLSALVPNKPTAFGLAPPELFDPMHGEMDFERPAYESSAMVGPWRELSRPAITAFFGENVTMSSLACLLLCGLWSLATWAFFGAAITRIAAVRLAGGEQLGLGAALRHACTKWRAYFSAPLFPIIGVTLAAIPVCILGLLLRANFGALLVGIIWPLLLLAGLLMAVLLLGLLFGWPLMWPTIGTEGTDSFDALSRSYAYVYQKPLQYLFYVIVAALFGSLGWFLVSNFAAGVVCLTNWAAAWGCGNERIALVVGGGEELGEIGGVGSALIRFWIGCVKLLAVGFIYSYFWTASTQIYLLLRRDVDATEMDEVFLDADADEEAVYDLPPVEQDEQGAPVVKDEPAEEEPKEEPKKEE